MVTLNGNYLKLPGSYLFSTIAKKVSAYQAAHPEADIIRLGIGDVTRPLPAAVIEALHRAVDEQAEASTFRGYAPDLGYAFLREAMAEHDFRARGCDIAPDEIFVSDGAKSDSANIQEIFGANCRIAVCDPVYPVYVDTNVMAGRAGNYDASREIFDRVIYMPCTAENGFVPELPEETPDLIYLCYPNNPTGGAITKEALQRFVDYANANGTVIIYDAAYEAYIRDDGQEGKGDIPHSIYECSGARTCAIELRSFSKNAGFTGLRLGATVIPHDLKARSDAADGREAEIHSLWARRHGTKYNGAPYIVQRAG
nr:LL-diaminopimelate aminotransferase [Lachnospiraceae bacterium]